MAAEASAFETLILSTKGGIAELLLNRPLKSNSISGKMWEEIPKAVRLADSMGDVRVVSCANRCFLTLLLKSTKKADASWRCLL